MWAGLDLSTRSFWRLAGRPVDLAGDHGWLRAPITRAARIRDGAATIEADGRASCFED